MSGWGDLGSVLGGGGDTSQAYETGRLRTAQTEGALAAAREHQLANMLTEAQAKDREAFRTQAAERGIDPAVVDATMGGFGSDYAAAAQGGLRNQEMGFRSTLANPAAPLGDQFAAGQGVQGQVLPQYNVSGGVAEDLLHRNGSLQPTPVGQAQIGAYDALAYDRMHPQPTGGGEGPNGIKVETGYMANPNYDPNDPNSPMVIPITGGSKDPNVGPAMGTRERQVIARVMTAGANTATDLKTWADMPSGVSQGTYGIGANPGAKVIDATMSSLKLKLAPEEIRMYNATLGGFSMQMQTLEKMGMQGSQGQAQQFDNLLFRDGDTVYDKMFKMATVRQTLENSFETILALNKNLPDEAKQSIQQTLDETRQNVPYDRQDVIALTEQQRKNPRLTLGELIEQKQMNTPVGTQAPRAPSPVPSNPGVVEGPGASFPAANARGWPKMRDKNGAYAYVGPNGEVEEIQ